jgi:hypothetical protein
MEAFSENKSVAAVVMFGFLARSGLAGLCSGSCCTGGRLAVQRSIITAGFALAIGPLGAALGQAGGTPQAIARNLGAAVKSAAP